MKRGKTEQETCDLNGWGVGTRLVGDEGYGPTVIEITSLHDGYLFAKVLSQNGVAANRTRSDSWTLSCREWVEVDPDAEREAAAQARGEQLAKAMHADGSLKAKSPRRVIFGSRGTLTVGE